MTQRKPAGMSFGSWIDQQINEAAERGAFEDLPGAGKPLPRRDETDAGQAWLHDYLRREGVPTEELLPAPLRLRKEAERLAGGAPAMRSEQEVREAVTALNQRIRDWRRLPLDSPIFVPLVDEEAMVSRWRQAQLTTHACSSQSGSDHRHLGAADPPPGRWRRLISLRHRRAHNAP